MLFAFFSGNFPSKWKKQEKKSLEYPDGVLNLVFNPTKETVGTTKM